MGVMLFLAVAISFCIRQAEVMAAERRLAELEKEIQYYEAMNEALLEQAETLRSDEYIEKTAREKLGLVKPGEVQYMLVINEEDTGE
jgi:cell division protein DivIC